MNTNDEIARAMRTVRNQQFVADLTRDAGLVAFLLLYGYGIYALTRYIIGV